MKTDKEKQEFKGPVKSVQVESTHYEVQEDGQTIDRLVITEMALKARRFLQGILTQTVIGQKK